VNFEVDSLQYENAEALVGRDTPPVHLRVPWASAAVDVVQGHALFRCRTVD